ELKTNLSLKYDFLKDDFDNGFEGFKDGISKNIDSIFQSEKFALLRLKIEKLSNLKSNLYELETNLDTVIFDTFKEFKMSEILNSLNINGAFFEFLNDKLKHYEKNQKSKLESLEKVLQSLKNQDVNILNSFEENLEKIEKLKQLEMGLLNAD
ncbi:ATP-binding protein, partial [Campylobacter jejuni]|nr:ATP-binding protein [Campylobacter jejuni]EIM0812432.1 ATP-binding protein [Campylobacter jejuni]